MCLLVCFCLFLLFIFALSGSGLLRRPCPAAVSAPFATIFWSFFACWGRFFACFAFSGARGRLFLLWKPLSFSRKLLSCSDHRPLHDKNYLEKLSWVGKKDPRGAYGVWRHGETTGGALSDAVGKLNMNKQTNR